MTSIVPLFAALWSLSPCGLQEPAPRLPGPTSLTVRVLDEQGEPAVGMNVRLHYHLGEAVIGTVADLDEEGRVQWLLEPPHQRVVGHRVVAMPTLDEAGSPDWSRATLIQLPDEQAGIGLDLGDLRLSSAPVLYAGTVRDDTGRPIPGATVVVEAAKSHAGGSADAEAWESLLMETLAGENGRFLIRGQAGYSKQEAELRISARMPGYMVGEELGAEPGSEDLDLMLVQAGSVEISWIVPEGLERSAMTYALTRIDGEGGDEPREGWTRGSPLRFEALRPGIYRVELFDELGTMVHAIDGVEVIAGEHSPDDRLRSIDLTGSVAAYEITVLDENGKNLRMPPMLWRAPTGISRTRQVGLRTDRRTFVILAASESKLSLLATANSYRPVILEDLGDGSVVRMQPSLEIFLKILDEPVLEKNGRYLGLSVLPYPLPDEGFGFRPGYAVMVYGGGPVRTHEVRALMPEPGEYLVRWTVYRRGPDGRPKLMGRVDGDVIQVEDDGEVRTFETPLPEEVWTVEPEGT